MSAQLQVTGEAKIRDLQGPVVANSGVITALDGAASQYVRGDGTLADFPTQTGGGSSVSYYLNGSVNQGTFGGSTYYQMSKNAITGTGTNFSTSADGLLAQFITDANDPDATSIPSGNWNIEFFMNVSASSGALASFYVEFYKYNGTTFTLVATNVATPEVLTGTTTIDAYYTSVAFPETALLQTDRLAIRIYANVASKTVTLYTEDNRLCQVVTTFSRGILSLNNLTDQQQYFSVGTSGSDFNIVSSLDTHSFNIPTASASNRGLLSTTDWSTFNAKQNLLNGTGIVKSTGGTISYLTDNTANWDTAYNNMIVSAAVTGTTTKTLTLTQQDAGTITASWTDDNTDAVTSVFGRAGAVTAQSGDYTTSLVTEGTNLYYTQGRFDSAFAAKTTTNLTEGTNLYYTQARFDSAFAAKTTSNLTEGTNLYFTDARARLALSAGSGISYNNTTGVITNAAPDQTVSLTAGAGISISGTYPSFNIASTITQYTDAMARAAISLTTTGTSGAASYNSGTGVLNIPQYTDQFVGTVTSVGLSVPTGFAVSGSPVTSSGTLALSFDTGYSLPANTLQSAWTTAYNDSIISAAVTGSTTKTLTLNQQDGGTITASWSDYDTAPVTSVFGRIGAVVATAGDYTTAQVTESGSLYFTDARARLALSFVAGSGAYNSSTGVITIPTNNNQITNGAGYITSSALSAYLPLTGGTLTGALSGTTATFSGLITANAGLLINTPQSITTAGTIGFQSSVGTFIYSKAGTDFDFRLYNGSGITVMSVPTGTTAATFSSSVTAGGNIQTSSAVNGGYFTMYESGNSNSRTWRMASDGYGFGDWALQRATAFNGSTFDNILVIQNGALTIGSNAGTGTGNLYASSGLFGGNLQSNGVLTIGNQSVAGNYVLQIYPSTTTFVALQGILAGVGASNIVMQPSGGNVLVGTTTDAGYKLDVNGEGRFSNTLTIKAPSSSTAIALLGRSSDNYSALRFLSNNAATTYATIYSNASDLIIENGGSAAITIASNRAATFSNSVTAGQLIVSAPATTSYGSLNALTNGYAYQEYKYNSTAYGYIGQHSAFISGASGTDLAVVSVNNLIFGTSGAFTERMRITSGGNVGIGTSSPVYKLVVSNSGAEGIEFIPAFGSNINVIQNYNRATSTWGTLDLRANDYVFRNQGTAALTIASTGAATFSSSVTASGTIRALGTAGQVDADPNYGAFRFYDGATFRGALGLDSWAFGGSASNLLTYLNGGNYSIYSSVANSKVFSVQSGGNVLVGTTTDNGQKLQVQGNARFNYSDGFGYFGLGYVSGADYGFYNYNYGRIDLKITQSTGVATFIAQVYAQGFYESSDKRLKKEISDNPTIANIESVKPKLYTKNDVEELGYYAQDLQEILPSAVSEGGDGFLSLSYTQVHTAKIAQLEDKIAQLEELVKTLIK